MATGAQDVTDREGEEEIFQVSEQQRQPGAMGGGGVGSWGREGHSGIIGKEGREEPQLAIKSGKKLLTNGY